MRIERVSGKEERRILIGMIVDSVVCGRIASKWQQDLFQSKWANIVGGLCVKFHTKHNAAPGANIEGLFDSWASSKQSRDKETVNLVERFLGGLSDEYEELAKEQNASYLIDLAAKHFKRVRLARLAETIQGDIDLGEVDDAEKRVNEFGSIDLGTGTGIDVLQDRSALEKAFKERAEPLIQVPGALGRFFGRSLAREGFIAFLAPEKVGKTTWLVALAWLAMTQRKRVAFFSVGDESEEEMMLRFAVRGSRLPLWPCTVAYPKSIVREEDEVSVVSEEREYKAPLSIGQAEAAFKKTQRLKVRSKSSYLRLSVHPNSSLTVKGMDAQLKVWEREGFVPDVIVGDYMDILLESGAGDDFRNRINQTWKDFRGLLQRWHALGITATQADAASYSAALLSKSNFSEDKRKLSHVTGMVGINQTEEEKEQGIQRLNWIVRRGDRFSSKACVHVAGAMELQNPAIRSCF